MLQALLAVRPGLPDADMWKQRVQQIHNTWAHKLYTRDRDITPGASLSCCQLRDTAADRHAVHCTLAAHTHHTVWVERCTSSCWTGAVKPVDCGYVCSRRLTSACTGTSGHSMASWAGNHAQHITIGSVLNMASWLGTLCSISQLALYRTCCEAAQHAHALSLCCVSPTFSHPTACLAAVMYATSLVPSVWTFQQ